MALSVAASIGAVQLLAGEPAASGTPDGAERKPRFLLSVGRMGHPAQGSGPEPWFQVRAIQQDRTNRLVDEVRPPPSAGQARELVAGPDGDFFAVSSRDRPCESRLYRFGLAGDGQVTGIEPLAGGVVPSRVAGLAISPDGDRIAYTTAPCDDGAQPSATLTVRDIESGDRRTWSTSGPTIIGGIVWADDNRTVGYTIGDVRPVGPSGTSRPGRTTGRDIRNVAVHALDTDGQLDTDGRGADLRGGRVLFRQPDGPGNVSTAVMAPDGRTGYGVLKKGEPPDTILFTFTEGNPMRVNGTIPGKSNTVQLVAVSIGEERPRYACLGGVDSLGRASTCGTTFAY
ncbi:hypothetical protein E1285_14670 [Actinomadura sp. 7K507]|nr:hypothetical protein E1285_14670 [Actinomadura sp. 7K507]